MTTTQTTTKTDKVITARCKPFRGQGVAEHRLMVEADGTVRVWDEIAGYYTTLHSLSEASQRRIRALAEAC